MNHQCRQQSKKNGEVDCGITAENHSQTLVSVEESRRLRIEEKIELKERKEQ
jgi:hypothetical protein